MTADPAVVDRGHDDAREWSKDDAVWEQLFGLMFSQESFELAEKRSTFPCGPGRHSVPLAKAGYAATGVDRTRAGRFVVVGSK